MLRRLIDVSVDNVTVSVGQGCLHLFLRVTPESSGRELVEAVDRATDDRHQVVTAAILGHKADLAVMAIGPDIWQLRRLQTDLRTAGFELVDSYVSMTELSEYAEGVPEEMRRARLDRSAIPLSASTRCRSAGDRRTGSRCRSSSVGS